MTQRSMAPYMWYGGKGNMVAKLTPLIPWSKVYCEPFFGAGSIFWNLRPRKVEIINDLNGDVVNVMRALQDPTRADKLEGRLAFTLYSLDEFRLALSTLAESTDPDERAWAFFVAQNQGLSGMANSEGNWGRAFISNRGMAANVSKWQTRLGMFGQWAKRIARAQIDHRDALEVIRFWDSPETVFYLDPPYASGTRVASSTNMYAHECDDAFHSRMVELLLTLKGQSVLSGYSTPLYAPLENAGWERTDWQTACHAAGKGRGTKLRGVGACLEHAARTESVWLSPNHRDGMGGRLF